MTHATDRIVSAFKAARERKAISQRELSTKAGVPQAQISKFENGAVDLRLSSLVSLVRALELEIELVPRKTVPAVEAIVRASAAREPNSPTRRLAVKEIKKLAEALEAIRSEDRHAPLTDNVLANLRLLERLQPSADQVAAIVKFNEAIQRSTPSDIEADVFAHHAKIIEQMRHQLAQTPSRATRPRPAYDLDSDEDDENE
jgi:transcriptional regulator with XRE-family HTH domain